MITKAEYLSGKDGTTEKDFLFVRNAILENLKKGLLKTEFLKSRANLSRLTVRLDKEFGEAGWELSYKEGRMFVDDVRDPTSTEPSWVITLS